MTVIARLATRNVCQVLTGRRNAVVTGSANADNLRVVDGIDRRPYI